MYTFHEEYVRRIVSTSENSQRRKVLLKLYNTAVNETRFISFILVNFGVHCKKTRLFASLGNMCSNSSFPMLKNCFLLNSECCCEAIARWGGSGMGDVEHFLLHTLITLRLCRKNKRIATFSRKNMHEKCTAPHWILHKHTIPLPHDYTTMEMPTTTTTSTTENLTIYKIFAAASKVVGVFSKRLPALHRLTSANLKFINTKRMENEMHGDPAA